MQRRCNDSHNHSEAVSLSTTSTPKSAGKATSHTLLLPSWPLVSPFYCCHRHHLPDKRSLSRISLLSVSLSLSYACAHTHRLKMSSFDTITEYWLSWLCSHRRAKITNRVMILSHLWFTFGSKSSPAPGHYVFVFWQNVFVNVETTNHLMN